MMGSRSSQTSLLQGSRSPELQSELACCDEGKTLEQFIDLAICLDNLLRSRQQPCPYLASAITTTASPETEPMQISFTHLNREERESRIHQNLKSKSNQIKSLLLSHHHSTSALVSEILMSVLQTVQKNQQTIYIWTDSAKKTAREHLQCSRQYKKNNNNLHMDRQCKKTTNNLHMDRQCKKTTNNVHMDRQCKKNNKQFTYGQTVQKNCTGAFTVLQTVQKKQQQFTYGQYIFTDCTEDNVQNTHTYTQYT